jgi:RNA polymerase sigma-70 factor (ECF subfamily)
MSHEAERLYERVVVVRCQTGDEEAYRELVRCYGPRLRYYLRKLLPRGDRTDDLLQEVWIDVFRQLPRLEDAGAFPAWVYRIARGKVALELRRNGRALPSSDDVDHAAASDDEDDFSPEEAARVHAALDRLPPDGREVLVLRFLEDMSYEEISLVIGCPLGTVRSRIHYAKQALRKLLEAGL